MIIYAAWHEKDLFPPRAVGRSVATAHPVRSKAGRLALVVHPPRDCKHDLLCDPQRLHLAGATARSPAVPDRALPLSSVATGLDAGADPYSAAGQRPKAGDENVEALGGHRQLPKREIDGARLTSRLRRWETKSPGVSDISWWIPSAPCGHWSSRRRLVLKVLHRHIRFRKIIRVNGAYAAWFRGSWAANCGVSKLFVGHLAVLKISLNAGSLGGRSAGSTARDCCQIVRTDAAGKSCQFRICHNDSS